MVRRTLLDTDSSEVGQRAASEAAAEIVRVERGQPRYGVDLDESTIPQEAGLNERAVSFTKGCYVGQETVARLHYRGKPNRHLRGLRLTAPASSGEELRLGERPVAAPWEAWSTLPDWGSSALRSYAARPPPATPSPSVRRASAPSCSSCRSRPEPISPETQAGLAAPERPRAALAP